MEHPSKGGAGRLLVLQASAAQAAGEPEAEEAIKEGFDLSEELFEELVQSHPTTMIDDEQVPVLEWLNRLTRVAM